jgi:hypothetical protein
VVEKTASGVKAAEERLMVNLSSRQRADFRKMLAALGSEPF